MFDIYLFQEPADEIINRILLESGLHAQHGL